MVAKVFLFVQLVYLLAAFSSAASSQTRVHWYTEDYPPFNYVHEGKLEGLSIKVLNLMHQKLEWHFDESDVLLMPWARVYYTLEESADACVFSIVHTPERESRFQFIGPMMENTVSIIGYKDSDYSNVELRNIPDIRIGVVKNDIGHQLLIKEGFKEYQFVYLKTGFELVRMLKMRRVDLIAYGDVIAHFQFNRAQIEPSDYKVVQPLFSSSIGFACNKAVSREYIKKMNEALQLVLQENPNVINWEVNK
ncbi:hypothetical protein PALB_26130 [Pseudoalteromonas luteoviolacea B = ATCC 29581]|nr:hypothetical protein PALB_26130 [Pseudoalteromonas luteoviolacea B = ATCC 29581]